ncbi:hypothetical protein [Bradyrhizobium pachyrhizi]|uniref:hypothetical protein n=1 Tax=Bradyrhizobium pachyrhizi TaxID=280333 RepID=UPI003D36BDA0
MAFGKMNLNGCGMAKSSSTKKTPKIEFEADAMERFMRAVDVVAKSPPQHRTGKIAKTKPVSKKKKLRKK